jgi:hypothetical protein
MTNTEFRDLISQSVRHIKDSSKQSTNFDLGAPSINLKIVLGIVRPFPVDPAALFSGYEPDERIISVFYTNLMMTVWKASVRSAFLKTSLNSLPLSERVLRMDEIMHVD